MWVQSQPGLHSKHLSSTKMEGMGKQGLSLIPSTIKQNWKSGFFIFMKSSLSKFRYFYFGNIAKINEAISPCIHEIFVFFCCDVQCQNQTQASCALDKCSASELHIPSLSRDFLECWFAELNLVLYLSQGFSFAVLHGNIKFQQIVGKLTLHLSDWKIETEQHELEDHFQKDGWACL